MDKKIFSTPVGIVAQTKQYFQRVWNFWGNFFSKPKYSEEQLAKYLLERVIISDSDHRILIEGRKAAHENDIDDSELLKALKEQMKKRHSLLTKIITPYVRTLLPKPHSVYIPINSDCKIA